MPVMLHRIENLTFTDRSDIPFETNLFDPYAHIHESVSADQQFTDAIINSMTATLEAIKSDNPMKILIEGWEDVVITIAKWFKEWIVRFMKYMRNAFVSVFKYIFKVEQAVGDIERRVRAFAPFEIQGYKYTIPDHSIDKCLEISNSIMDNTSTYINRVIEHRYDKIDRLTSEAITSLTSMHAMNEYRGSLIDENYCPSTEFSTALREYFRDGESHPIEITVTPRLVNNLRRDITKLRSQIDICKVEHESLKKQADRIISHLDGQPRILSKFAAKKQEKHNATLGPTRDSIAISRIYDPDSEIYKSLSSICAAGNSALRQAHMMGDRFMTEKLIALKEAVQQYAKCVAMARRASV